MKRILVFSLLFVYTTLACGLNLQLHYCGGKLKNISVLNTSDESGCCGSKMKKSKGCCNDKTTYLKVKDKHNSNSSLKVITFKGKLSDISIPSFTLNLHHSIKDGYPDDYYTPPVLYDNPLYLKLRVLII